MNAEATPAPRQRSLKWVGLLVALVVGLGVGIGFDRFILTRPAPSVKGETTMPSETTGSHGIIVHRSPWALDQTLQRLQAAFATRGLKVFTHLDQRAEARAVGLDQPPMHLLLVGNPRAGTPLMVATPQIGLDLPLKVLVWESTPGAVEVGLNSADYLAARHGLTPEQVQGLRGLESLVKTTLTE